MYFVYSKIDVNKAQQELSKLSWVSIVAGILLFVLSIICSSIRLTYIIRDIGINISFWTNTKLYMLGMFYNIFIPGGVGGDAYKIFYLNKKFDVKTKESFWPFLIDRGSGMFALLVLILICGFFIDLPLVPHLNLILISLMVFGFISIYFIIRIMRKAHLTTFFYTMPLSFLTQISQAAMVYLFIHEIGVSHHSIEYFLLFFVSSIASIIPITPGGMGLREATYHFGSTYLEIDEHIGTFVASLFFVITLLVSFTGIYYHFKGVDNIKQES
jgi:uncharacterized membrane protein YbhN (UPF0104 family)